MGYIQITERRNIGGRLLTQDRPLDVGPEFFASHDGSQAAREPLNYRAVLGGDPATLDQPLADGSFCQAKGAS